MDEIQSCKLFRDSQAMLLTTMPRVRVRNAALAVATVAVATVIFFLGHRSGGDRDGNAAPAATETYDRMVASGRPTLIDFYADWCLGCQMNAPVVEDLEQHLAEQINVLRVDVDKPENASFVRRFHVEGIPHYVFLSSKGTTVDVKVGWLREAELRAAVDALVGLQSTHDRTDGLYGYIDRSGRMVIRPRFVLAGEFTNGEAFVLLGTKDALIERTGRVKRYLNPQETAALTTADLQPFELKGKWGFQRQDGKPGIPARFDEVTNFTKDRAGVRVGSKWGFIDRTGTLVIPLQFDEVQRFWAGRAAVHLGERWGFIDERGKVVIPIQFEQVGRFRKAEPLTAVRKEGLWGFLDAQGRWVVRPQFAAVETTTEGMSPVRQGKLWGFIDNSGRLSVPARYEQVGAFAEGFAWVFVQGKYAFVDRTGKQITGFLFDRVRPFSSDGIAPVEVKGRWGYIDRGGRFVLTPRFADATPFSQGLAAVRPAFNRRP